MLSKIQYRSIIARIINTNSIRASKNVRRKKRRKFEDTRCLVNDLARLSCGRSLHNGWSRHRDRHSCRQRMKRRSYVRSLQKHASRIIRRSNAVSYDGSSGSGRRENHCNVLHCKYIYYKKLEPFGTHALNNIRRIV